MPAVLGLSCGLLAVLLQLISDLVAGESLWAVLAIFCGLVLVGTTFISHTVGAMVILPIVQSVGQHMPGDDHSKLLVMGAALMCSGGSCMGSNLTQQCVGSHARPFKSNQQAAMSVE